MCPRVLPGSTAAVSLPHESGRQTRGAISLNPCNPASAMPAAACVLSWDNIQTLCAAEHESPFWGKRINIPEKPAEHRDMPYRDESRQREYQREYQRNRRKGSRTGPATVELLASFRLRTAQDLVELMQEQIEAVRGDRAARTIEKARCIASLVNVALRTLEQRDLTTRIEALEAVLNEPERKLRAV